MLSKIKKKKHRTYKKEIIKCEVWESIFRFVKFSVKRSAILHSLNSIWIDFIKAYICSLSLSSVQGCSCLFRFSCSQLLLLIYRFTITVISILAYYNKQLHGYFVAIGFWSTGAQRDHFIY